MDLKNLKKYLGRKQERKTTHDIQEGDRLYINNSVLLVLDYKNGDDQLKTMWIGSYIDLPKPTIFEKMGLHK